MKSRIIAPSRRVTPQLGPLLSLSKQIPYFTVFWFTATLDIGPPTAVSAGIISGLDRV